MLKAKKIGVAQATSYYEKDGYYVRLDDKDNLWDGHPELKSKYGIQNQTNVTKEDFDKILMAQNEKRAGYDFCFSAPKSISVAMCTSDEAQRDMIEAHNTAVSHTLQKIEKQIGARVTNNKKTETIQTGKMLCARFNHYVSRANDPQLHTHAVIINKTLHNGKLYATDMDEIFKNMSLYGHLYRNQLANELLKRGYELKTTDPDLGFFELAGIGENAIKEFSKRRAEIEEKVEEWGKTTHEAGEQATLRTRGTKKSIDLEKQMIKWRGTLDELGQSGITKEPEPILPTERDIKAIFDRTISKMSRKSFAFTERDMKKTFLGYGVSLGVTEEHFNTYFQAGLGNELRSLGELKNGLDTQEYFSTAKNYQMEQDIYATVKNSQGRMKGIAPDRANALINKIAIDENGKVLLNDEQRCAVEAITTTQDQHYAIQGLAGTGKTHMLKFAGQVWEAEGYKVLGACYTGKAANGLQNDAEITSGTLHRHLNELEKEAGNRDNQTDFKNKSSWNLDGLKPGPQKEVWVVDEASMVDNVAMWYLMKAAELKEAKVVYIGDDKQHAPVGVGNAFGTMIQKNKINYVTMQWIMRQKDKELLEGVLETVKGDPLKAFDKIKKKTQIVPEKSDRLNAIVKDYLSLTPDQQNHTVILTAANSDRKAINRSIRGELKKAGVLQDGIKLDTTGESGNSLKREFSVNDKVIFLQNDKRLGVMNGQTGFVEAIRDQTLIIVSDKDPSKKRTVTEVNLNEYKHIDHGYAMTSHKAQGITIDRAIIHMDSHQARMNSRNAFYVNLSRARYEVKLYTDDIKKIKNQVKDFAKKLTSEDFEKLRETTAPNIGKKKDIKPKEPFEQKLEGTITAHRLSELAIAYKLGYRGKGAALEMKENSIRIKMPNNNMGYLAIDKRGRCLVWDDKNRNPTVEEYRSGEFYKAVMKYEAGDYNQFEKIKRVRDRHKELTAIKEMTMAREIKKGPEWRM